MAQADYFLKLEGIEGESQDDKHKNEIHVSSFSFGVHQHRHRRLEHWVPARGKSNVQDMHFTKVDRQGLAESVHRLRNGKHFTKATITVRKAGEKPQEYLIYKMTEVFISVDHRPAATRAAASRRRASRSTSRRSRSSYYAAERRRLAGRDRITEDLRLKANKAS